jgi:hypothetical protein
MSVPDEVRRDAERIGELIRTKLTEISTCTRASTPC